MVNSLHNYLLIADEEQEESFIPCWWEVSLLNVIEEVPLSKGQGINNLQTLHNISL